MSEGQDVGLNMQGSKASHSFDHRAVSGSLQGWAVAPPSGWGLMVTGCFLHQTRDL